MFVLSGKCRIGDVGEPTKLVDITDKELFVGDIVIVSNTDERGITGNHGLSVVCSDRWTSYSNGTNVEKTGTVEHFVMGIKSVDFMGADSDKWTVQRVKSHTDVIDGERWTDYGFSYSSDT